VPSAQCISYGASTPIVSRPKRRNAHLLCLSLALPCVTRRPPLDQVMNGSHHETVRRRVGLGRCGSARKGRIFGSCMTECAHTHRDGYTEYSRLEHIQQRRSGWGVLCILLSAANPRILLRASRGDLPTIISLGNYCLSGADGRNIVTHPPRRRRDPECRLETRSRLAFDKPPRRKQRGRARGTGTWLHVAKGKQSKYK